MRSGLLLFLALFLTVSTVQAQRNCGSMELLEQQINDNPERARVLQELDARSRNYSPSAKEFSNGVVTIPVIVHVVWNTSSQNISDAQIASQMEVLNDDFRRLNADRTDTPNDFAGVAADTEIEFCLIETIRVNTGNRRGFGTNDSVKSSGGKRGGSDVVTPDQALNVWVCNIGGGILGYAQFPGGPASTDGVVCDYRYFGTTGTATAPFDLGRTMTHEVGHYLGLRHIWGDTGCGGDDFVSDTPLAGSPNYTGGACTYPGPNSCNEGSGDLPDMFQNYMDYSDDVCMNLFTAGQKARMLNVLNGSRSSLLSASCDGGNPPVQEICDNGIDDDGDNLIDCDDPDCASFAGCDNPPTGCDAPTGLTSSIRKGGREIRVSWNGVGGANGYEVEFTQNGSTRTASTSGTSATFSSARGASYTWRVRSVCGSDVSDWANASSRATSSRVTQTGIQAFPNPIRNGEAVVTWSVETDVTVSVTAINGQLLRTQRVAAGINRTNINMDDLAAGVYIINVISADGSAENTKLVKL